MSRENSLIILIAILTLALAGGCASLPENVERPQSYAFTDTENTAFAKMRAEESAAHPGESGFRLLGNGLDAFVARALLAHYAERSIDVQYFLYHDDLVGRLLTDQLFKAADRGVRVRILTNSLTSNNLPIVHTGYSKYRKELLCGGIELYELNKKMTSQQRKENTEEDDSSKATLHSKSFVFDDNRVFIGSLNLDPRAVVHNTEIGVVLSSVEIAGHMRQWFEQNIERVAFRLELAKDEFGSDKILWHGMVDGRKQTLDVDPYTGFWQRFWNWFLRILPESQL
jgi:phosphatidylserine/phosphatidylglycerophosphate/cardiolipin synthase-like enzyme